MFEDLDYSVYLVTDSSLVPEDCEFLDQIDSAINNGATIVQLREKYLSTKDFIERAEKVHKLTKKKNVPLIINDRVDVALAIDAEGVHVGQDDMDVSLVRKLIGPDRLLGLSVSNVNEVLGAIEKRDVIDYVGIGAVFDTSTKKLIKKPQGYSGVRQALKTLYQNGGENIKTVAIGGINEKNTTALMYTATSEGKSLDGIAVVSVIMASKTPGEITQKLSQLVKNLSVSKDESSKIVADSELVLNVLKFKPLTHQITNSVVKNFSANVTLSIGASPIMSENVKDFDSLAKIPNSGLLINAGTVSGPESFKIYSSGIISYNLSNKPIVFDPVAAGASEFRKSFCKDLLDTGHITCIKGNHAEILTLAGAENIEMKGVDSETFAIEEIIKYAKKLALETRSIVVVTGKDDIIVEGNLTGKKDIPIDVKQQVVIIKGGHELMGKITGSGCSLGSVIASYTAANPTKQFSSVITAVALYKHSGGVAGKKSDGPGSFISNFLDILYKSSVENKPETWEIEYEYL